jgi:sulfide:quinone oxidoreductase
MGHRWHRPARLAWRLKRILPPVYWLGMLKGREWLAAPQVILSSPDTPEVA